MNFEGTVPVQMYCPNCGAKVVGFRSSDGAVRIICSRCAAKIFSKQKSKREVDIRLTVAI